METLASSPRHQAGDVLPTALLLVPLTQLGPLTCRRAEQMGYKKSTLSALDDLRLELDYAVSKATPEEAADEQAELMGFSGAARDALAAFLQLAAQVDSAPGG
jgi:hypothetical protein